jgi:NhaP-type Na+/H+ and K+/H+ antiporter
MAAVFWAGARVPIATMLMVTEMTGGYHLLAPAGSAVMVSYLLLQGTYPHSFNLLGNREVQLTDDIGHLDLPQLLQSPVHVDLPGGREVAIGAVRTGSAAAGKSIADVYSALAACDFEIIAVMRNEHVLLPQGQTQLEPSDRVIVIAGRDAEGPLGSYISFSASPAKGRGSGVNRCGNRRG